MNKLDIAYLMTISQPVIERFSMVEPKPWTRKTILLELLGELGSLAHLVQYWEGFKRGTPHLAQLNDECSDVLFIILRLAYHDGSQLPKQIEIHDRQVEGATTLVLELYADLAVLLESTDHTTGSWVRILQKLGSLARMLGVDLVQAHEQEMNIALQYFHAAGEHWPKPQFMRHPVATFQLWRLVWKRGKT